jgi:hypothetical protein
LQHIQHQNEHGALFLFGAADDLRQIAVNVGGGFNGNALMTFAERIQTGAGNTFNRNFFCRGGLNNSPTRAFINAAGYRRGIPAAGGTEYL